MPKTHPPHSPEFRRQIVDLVRTGRDPADLAREFEPTAQAIRNWVVQADRQEGRREEKGDGLSTAEREELARLRRENKQLRVERDILLRMPPSALDQQHGVSLERRPRRNAQRLRLKPRFERSAWVT